MLEDLREMISEIKIKSKKLQSAKRQLEEKVRERTKELNDKLYELEKFNKVAVNRELKMIELKNY